MRRRSQGERGKGKRGALRKCPKCGYSFKSRQTPPLICCSKCKRWFKI